MKKKIKELENRQRILFNHVKNMTIVVEALVDTLIINGKDNLKVEFDAQLDELNEMIESELDIPLHDDMNESESFDEMNEFLKENNIDLKSTTIGDS
jgi:hypothetical protein